MATTTLTQSQSQEERFRELMNSTYKKVFNLAYRLSGDRTDAEDLTQEAFYRAYRGLDGYEGDKPFENWIFRIVTRLFLDLRRTRRRRVTTVSYDAPFRNDQGEEIAHFQATDPTPTAEETMMNSVMNHDLQLALSQLKPDQRALVLLADVEQVSYQDIATSLGIPIGTVRSRLHRAHKKLRSIMQNAQARRQREAVADRRRPCVGCPA